MRIKLRHDIKILREHYEEQCYGGKQWELRKDDRDYRDGDELLMRVWSKEKGYDGSFVVVKVVKVYRFLKGLDPLYCLISTARDMKPYDGRMEVS